MGLVLPCALVVVRLTEKFILVKGLMFRLSLQKKEKEKTDFVKSSVFLLSSSIVGLVFPVSFFCYLFICHVLRKKEEKVHQGG